MKDSHSQKAAAGHNAATGTHDQGYSRGTSKYSGNMNQHGNPDALINKGRGPTLGGTAMPACGKEMFTGKSQVRQAVSDGATTAMPKLGKETFDFGRGPTKGNQ
tara:strand:- start:78 stop:389 length:312 start_codon:yes stop_codon:yes gene_type:complete